LGLRIAAIVCWLSALTLCILAGRNVIENSHGPGAARWEPIAFVLVAVAVAVIGWRVWALKLWACLAAVIVLALFCLIDPWQPSQYANAVVEVPWALATSIVSLVLFAVPLAAATYVERKDLQSGF